MLCHPSRSGSQLEGRMGPGSQGWESGVPVSAQPSTQALLLLLGASSRKRLGSGKLKTEWTHSAHCWDYG